MVIDNGYILELKSYVVELEFLNHVEDEEEMVDKTKRILIVVKEIERILNGELI